VPVRFIVYIFLSCAGALLGIGTSIFAWRRRNAWAGRTFFFFIACCAFWSASLVVSFVAGSQEWAHFWTYRVRVSAGQAVGVRLTDRNRWLTGPSWEAPREEKAPQGPVRP